MTGPDRLTQVQTRAISALLTSRTFSDASTAAGVSERTLRRWLAAEPFASAYRAAARHCAREAISALLAAQREAVDLLRTALSEGTPANRVRAARALLELGIRVGSEDLDERITELEKEVQTWDAQSHPTPRHASTK